ncbi:hypothetical protein EDD11_004009 [Mortierella claussenii]|nr:hypothetical protein EDD11_004009 [Mortierella claussenii]
MSKKNANPSSAHSYSALSLEDPDFDTSTTATSIRQQHQQTKAGADTIKDRQSMDSTDNGHRRTSIDVDPTMPKSPVAETSSRHPAQASKKDNTNRVLSIDGKATSTQSTPMAPLLGPLRCPGLHPDGRDLASRDIHYKALEKAAL